MSQPQRPSPNDSFVTTSLGGGGMSTRKLLILFSLGALLLATVGGTVFLLRDGTSASSSTYVFVPSKPAPTAIPTATRPPAPTLGPAAPPSGFSSVGPSGAQNVAFGVGVEYFCGQDQQGVNFFAVSKDLGGTWTSASMPAQGYCSDIAVNPRNPRDIGVTVNPCPAGCKNTNQAGLIGFVSQDGGATWRQLVLPDASSTIGGRLVWGSDRLWLSCNGQHLLGMALADGRVSWIDFGVAILSGSYPSGLFATHNALFAGMVSSTTGGLITLRSDDLGKTWRAVTFIDSNDEIEITGATADGSILYGEAVGSRIELSRDDGKTWHAAPLTSGFLTTFTVAVDGTVVALSKAQSFAFQTLAPQSATWQTVFQGEVGGDRFAGVSLNASGHPNAIWLGGVGSAFALFRL